MIRSSSSLSLTTPSQVWPQLTADRRHRALRCLAQLALKVVTAEADRVVPELPYEHSDHTPQAAR